MMGLFDLGNVISLTGFKSHVLHSLTMPFSNPPAMTLMETPSGWLEKATEQMISLQWTCPTRGGSGGAPAAQPPGSPAPSTSARTAQEPCA